ncbi:MAG: LON peptidase substrate-binding domain-containing protein [Solirubrobacteraceae bacterium]
MSAQLSREFPLFPLGLVALPQELIRLHIFEPRYQAMMQECLAHEREFGIVWMSDDTLREIGCAAAIEQVLERMPDGRMNLLTRGTRPIRVLERQGHLPYPAGVVEFVEDRSEGPDPELQSVAHEIYADLLRRATDRNPDEPGLEQMSAYAMAATVDFGLEAKQELLELRSETARLALLIRLLRAALKRVDFIGRAGARARSNGKVRFE